MRRGPRRAGSRWTPPRCVQNHLPGTLSAPPVCPGVPLDRSRRSPRARIHSIPPRSEPLPIRPWGSSSPWSGSSPRPMRSLAPLPFHVPPVPSQTTLGGVIPSLLGLDLVGKRRSFGLMSSQKLSTEISPRRVLFCCHLGIVNFGFDVRMDVEKLREQQSHFPAVPAIELNPSWVHRLLHFHYSLRRCRCRCRGAGHDRQIRLRCLAET